MTPIQFTVTVDFDAEPRRVWDEMIDWKGHEQWIPSTRVEVPDGDATAVGTEFTAWTGPGPLALEDRMRVSECRWDDETETGYCEVEKLGPVLQGRAGFTVRPHPRGAEVEWFEDVTVPVAPKVTRPVIERLSAGGFRLGMRRLGKIVNR
ncbi:MAG: SRPBCC family protein [Acidimicrobiia bacterium]|nr:SRPBCC family protein [Acidimicrobiia bacterium]